MKILLVEDHADLAAISCSQLREIHEHEVVHVTDGKSAIAALKEFRPDLILLDLNLPDMTGYDVAANVRANADWSSVVLVALTGFASDIDPLRAGASGIDAHFRKPMDFDALPYIHRKSA